VQAAKLRREGAPYIMFVELLPNVLPPILVEFTVRLGYAIFATVTLTFLGFGIQPPAPDWGLSIYDHYAFISGGIWWPVLFPALAIASLVVGVNLASDAISQALER
jgi:peptide/nickel transport system permease protein